MVRESHQALEGRVFGRWTVVARKPNINNGIVVYECRCICGTTRDVRSMHLMSGASASCGCYSKENPGRLTHGQARVGQHTKKYRTWRKVLQRCTDPNDQDYERYKGKLCEEWKTFENFDRDVPDPASDDLSIERKENDKGYEPGNVRWATMAEQHRNQSNCRWIEFQGERKLLTDWAQQLGLSHSGLSDRIAKHGVEKAFTMPIEGKKSE